MQPFATGSNAAVEGFSSGSEEMSEVLAAVPVAHAVYSFLLCSSMVPWPSGNALELSRRFESCRHSPYSERIFSHYAFFKVAASCRSFISALFFNGAVG